LSLLCYNNNNNYYYYYYYYYYYISIFTGLSVESIADSFCQPLEYGHLHIYPTSRLSTHHLHYIATFPAVVPSLIHFREV